VTQFNAGTKENIVPESATLIVDRRVLPSEDFDTVHGEIESLLDEVRTEHEIEIDMEVMQTYEPSATPANSEVAETFRKESNAVAGVPDERFGIRAATDTRDFINGSDIEAITWGPGDIEQAHTFDEHIDLAEAATGLEILDRAVRDLLDVPSDD
jgi:succinyl-diaminopimelate desuccinylase